MYDQRNHDFPKENPLHMLASFSSINSEEKVLLDKWLNGGSYLWENSLQKSAEGRTPLCTAIYFGNIDFIKIFAGSGAATERIWSVHLDFN